MAFRGWGNSLSLAGMIISLGGLVLQNSALRPTDDGFWWVFGGIVAVAGAAVFLSRPTRDEVHRDRLHDLRKQLTERSMAMLKAASQHAHSPKGVSDLAIAYTPRGHDWPPETETRALKRANGLISPGLLAWRNGSEVETTDLGRALLGYDDALRIVRREWSPPGDDNRPPTAPV